MRAILLALLCSTAHAEPWTAEQKSLAGVEAALLVADYGQTKTIATTQHRWVEYNPILGRHPSMGRVNAVFVLTPLIGYFALDALPSETRTWALRAITFVEAGVVGRNAYLGIHARF